jgi:hypothetical protein
VFARRVRRRSDVMVVWTRAVVLASAAAISCVFGTVAASAEVTSFTLGSKGSLAADRQHATVTGTITCTEGDAATVNANIVQVVGRLLVNASGSSSLTCSGQPQSWSVTVATFGTTTLRLAAGKATLGWSAIDQTDFTAVGGNTTVLLKP